jgi:methionyl-tRNA formyltransferase
MGTPDFAVPPLVRLTEDGHRIGLVVTQPDRARDRGRKTQCPPVKAKAIELGLAVAQPECVRENIEFLDRIRALAPDLIVVTAYGKLLPAELLEIPRLGCVNIHASLLPEFRGAAPIHRSVIAGGETTGVTLMYMDEGLDTGDMIAFRSTPIGKKTMEKLHDELSEMGAELLAETLPAIESGNAERTKQEDAKATYAPPVRKAEGLLDFRLPPERLERLVRGLNSWPGAYTFYRGQPMKLWQAETLDEASGKPDGTITGVSAHGIKVAAGGRTLLLQRIQMPGKRSMDVSEFIKGNAIAAGEVLGGEE